LEKLMSAPAAHSSASADVGNCQQPDVCDTPRGCGGCG
jgi:hypothetical protein